MDTVRSEKQRFQWSVLSLVNVLVAILAIIVAAHSLHREPPRVPERPGVETRLRQGITDREVRAMALDQAERGDEAHERLRAALQFQQVYAWLLAALLIVNSVGLTLFFRRMRKSQKQEDLAISAATPPPSSPAAPPRPAEPEPVPRSQPGPVSSDQPAPGPLSEPLRDRTPDA